MSIETKKALSYRELVKKMVEDKRTIITHLQEGKSLSELKNKGINLVRPI